MYDIFWYHARNPTIILQKKQEIPPKPQLTVYTFPAKPQDTVSL